MPESVEARRVTVVAETAGKKTPADELLKADVVQAVPHDRSF
jgi:hypothetical protein